MIQIGTSTPSKIYIGDLEVARIYAGATEVWSGIDEDAAAYISAIELAGATVLPAYTKAINEFIKGEKTANRWNPQKRLYLPMWSVEAANAICMVTRLSGNFVGAVTHGIGYVQGDGSTGYFDTNAIPASIGMSLTGGHAFAYVTRADTRTDVRFMLGQTDVSNRRVYINQNSTTEMVTALYNSTVAIAVSRSTGRKGIYFGNVLGDSNRYFKKLNGSEVEFTSTRTTLNSANPSPDTPVFVMANNNQGTAESFSNAFLSCYGLGAGLSAADANNFMRSVFQMYCRIFFTMRTGIDWQGYEDETVAYIVQLIESGAIIE